MISGRVLGSLEFEGVISYLASFCVTDAGRALASATAPFLKREEAERELDLYEQFLVWKSSPEVEKFAIIPFADIRGLILNAEAGRAPVALEDFWALREALRLGEKARLSVGGTEAEILWPALLRLSSLPTPQKLLAALNRCVSDDGLLKDNATPELYRIRNELRATHRNCLQKARDYAQKYNIAAYLQDDFITLASDRYVLPLKANFKGRLRGIIHDWSNTGETCYFEPMFLVEINNRVRQLKHEEREEERRALAYLGSLFIEALEAVKGVREFLARLDFLNAKSRFAEAFNARRAIFSSPEEGIELFGARHPLLILEKRDGVKPLDIILRPGDKVLIITGGNAGGKTVCLKTLGVISLLAMSGLPVPVDAGSHLPWFERMDAFIGDEQSIREGVSTFTARIERLSREWDAIDSRGLVLLDEFGSGTDPAEGAALARATLDGLLEKGCFVLSATHFPALKSYALTQKGVRAASMLFNPKTETPLYKLAYDQVGASQALVAAAACGLPAAILERARRYLLQGGEDISQTLDKLNALALERENEAKALREERKKAEALLKEKKEKLDRERERLGGEIRERITELTRAWRAGKAGAKQTIKEMSGLRESLGLGPARENASVLARAENFRVGQTVTHSVFNKRGVVTDVDEKRKRVRLDMNGVGTWADMKDLLDAPGVEPKTSGSVNLKRTDESASLSVDVRGMRADEAVAEVSRFLDKALLSGFSGVEIIHGRGTGVLRRQIHDFLRSFSAAREVSLAPEDRGGDGVTEVRLD